MDVGGVGGFTNIVFLIVCCVFGGFIVNELVFI
jgi:hypothetical protein